MTNMTRRAFLASATATVAAGTGCVTLGSPTVDDNLTVFLSDLHVRDRECFQYRYFAEIVDEVLALRPRPKRIVLFGDLAYSCGLRSEYETSYGLLKKFLDAGMEITIGMGNHDRRSTFLEVWPEYRKRTLVPGKIVTLTNLGSVDLLMLDGLQGADDRADNEIGPVSGKLDAVQQEWLYGYLAKLRRPTIVASHYPLQEMCGEGRPLADRFRDYANVVGYVYGHLHRWDPYWTKHGWGMDKLLRNLCLPSTGHWGDIGYVTFRAEEHKAVAKFVRKDFFFNNPVEDAAHRPPEWDDIRDERSRDVFCTFRY